VLAREPEDREGAARHRERLHDREEQRARPDPEEGREHEKERVDMRSEPALLTSLQRRRLEEVPVQRVPDRLHHVPAVEPSGLERDVVEHGREHEQRRVRGHTRVDNADRDRRITGIQP